MYNLAMLYMLLADSPIVVAGLVIAIVGIVIAMVAAVAAISAARYAKAAPTKEDLDKVQEKTTATSELVSNVHAHLAAINEELKRVETCLSQTSERLETLHGHLEATNRRLDTEQVRDALLARVNKIPLRFMGEVEPGRDGQFTITTKDENVVLNRVDLYNESENKFGSAPCEVWKPPLQVLIRVDGATFMKWYEAGSFINGNHNQDRKLFFRVHMKLKDSGEEISRPMSVTAKTLMPQPVGQGMTPLKFRVFGEV